MDPFTAARLLEVARSQLGVKESPPGSNRNKYGQAVGRDGQPWCAMFVTWCFREIGRPLPDINGPDGLFTYCPSAVAYARNHQQVTAAPEPGDIVLYDWQHDGVSDHVGIVETVLSPGMFRAVEGNTAVGQDSDGGEVMSRIRHVGDVTLFWRPPIEPLTKTTGSEEDEDVAQPFLFTPVWAQIHQDGPFVGRKPQAEVNLAERKLYGYNGCTWDPGEVVTGFAGVTVVDLSDSRLCGTAPIRGFVLEGDVVCVTVQGGAQYRLQAIEA